MNTFEIVTIGIALALNCISVHIAGGHLLSREAQGLKLLFIFSTFIVQFIMLGLGLWVGQRSAGLMPEAQKFAAMVIFFIFGIKMLFSKINVKLLQTLPDFKNFGIRFWIALVEGITPMCLGIAIGLVSLFPMEHWAILGGIMFAGVFFGFLLGSRLSRDLLNLRFSSVAALFVLGIAIKFAIDLIS